MTIQELKQRVTNKLNELIDLYFGENNIVDKLTNVTLKVMLENNKDKMDDFLKLMADEKGEINSETLLNAYTKEISDEGVPFDIKNYIKSDVVRSILPNKSLLITKDDIEKILRV